MAPPGDGSSWRVSSGDVKNPFGELVFLDDWSSECQRQISPIIPIVVRMVTTVLGTLLGRLKSLTR